MSEDKLKEHMALTLLASLEHFGIVKAGMIKAGDGHIRIYWVFFHPTPDNIIGVYDK